MGWVWWSLQAPEGVDCGGVGHLVSADVAALAQHLASDLHPQALDARVPQPQVEAEPFRVGRHVQAHDAVRYARLHRPRPLRLRPHRLRIVAAHLQALTPQPADGSGSHSRGGTPLRAGFRLSSRLLTENSASKAVTLTSLTSACAALARRTTESVYTPFPGLAGAEAAVPFLAAG